MKKIKIFSLTVFCIVILGSIGVMAEESWKVLVSSQKFVVNGKSAKANALNINGNNYLKVAEFAELLDVDISFDENTNTISFDKSKAFSGVKTITKSSSDVTLKSEENQIVKIDIKKLAADEYIALDLCNIQGSDEITFDITSNGKGVLFVGFMKDKDEFGTTYFGNGDFYGEKGKIESTFKVNGFDGKYYFFVKNNGNEKMENIKGTVTIVRK